MYPSCSPSPVPGQWRALAALRQAGRGSRKEEVGKSPEHLTSGQSVISPPMPSLKDGTHWPVSQLAQDRFQTWTLGTCPRPSPAFAYLMSLLHLQHCQGHQMLLCHSPFYIKPVFLHLKLVITSFCSSSIISNTSRWLCKCSVFSSSPTSGVLFDLICHQGTESQGNDTPEGTARKATG